MKYLIIGGTGTLGSTLIEKLYGKGEIICFSRGELAQKTLGARFPKVKMVIGDVRDREAVRRAMRRVDTVFHLAAIKHIDVAEENPLETIKTNVLGSVVVAEEAIDAWVANVVFSNTDKAVMPITTYGYTKAIAQNYLLSMNGQSDTLFSVFNWGNIIASRGSAIPYFVKALLENKPVPVTDVRMSRFWLTIDAAAQFMIDNYETAPKTHAMIPAVKGATVVRVIEAIARILGIKNYSTKNVGIRGIEKFHEVLESRHDGCIRSDNCEQYSDRELDLLLTDVVLAIAGDGRLPPTKLRGAVC